MRRKVKSVSLLTLSIIFTAFSLALSAQITLSAVSLAVKSTGGEVSDTDSFIAALGDEEAAYANGNTVVFLSDVELSGCVSVKSGDYVISGTGCYITRADGYTGPLIELSGGNLVIGSDSGSDDHPSLTIDSLGQTSESAAIVVTGGSLTVCPGTAVVGNVNKTSSEIQNSGSGGALNITGGSVVIKGGDFTANEADNGGAVCVLGGEAAVAGGSFNECKAQNGGAFYVGDNGSLAIGGIEITKNSADMGGAIFNDGECILTGAALTYNTAESFGGAVVSSGNLTMANSAIAYCTTPNGPGGLMNFGKAELTGVQITGCEAYRASAVSNSGDLTLTECEMNYNTASDSFTVYNNGSIYMSGGSISSNTANSYCGGIGNWGEYVVDGGSISSNKSKGFEYGLAFFNAATLELKNKAFLSFNNDVLMIFGEPTVENGPTVKIESVLTANTPVITITPAVYDETSVCNASLDFTLTSPMITSGSLSGDALSAEIEKTAVSNDAANKKAYILDPNGVLKANGRVHTEGEGIPTVWIITGAGILLAAAAGCFFGIRTAKKRKKKTASDTVKKD